MEHEQIYVNHCKHKQSEFICNFVAPASGGELHMFDLYVHNENDVCIRYGNEPHEYMSPSLEMVIWSTSSVKQEAWRILKSKYELCLKKRSTPEQ